MLGDQLQGESLVAPLYGVEDVIMLLDEIFGRLVNVFECENADPALKDQGVEHTDKAGRGGGFDELLVELGIEGGYG